MVTEGTEPKTRSDVRPLQVVMKDVRVATFLDTKFLGMIQKELPQIMAVSLVFIAEGEADVETGKPKTEKVGIWHRNRKEQRDGVMIVDADDPETLVKIMRVVESFTEAADVSR